jgi:plasmid stabilization system protein ParE
MAKKIIWSTRSEASFYKVVEYLKENWSDKEIDNFLDATEKVINYISEHPLMFRKTNKKNIHEALVTPQNLLIYKIYVDRIVLIMFYDTRQSPRKKKFK